VIVLEHSVLIYRPIAEVFAFLGNPTNDPHWAGSVWSSERTDSGPLGAGSTYRQVSKFLGIRSESSSRIESFKQGEHVQIRGVEVPELGFERREFVAIGSDTRWIRRIEVEVGSMFFMAEGLVHSAAQKQIETDMALAKTILDARTEHLLLDPAAT